MTPEQIATIMREESRKFWNSEGLAFNDDELAWSRREIISYEDEISEAVQKRLEEL